MKVIAYSIGGQIKFYQEGSLLEYSATYPIIKLGMIDLPIAEQKSDSPDIEVTIRGKKINSEKFIKFIQENY